MEHEWRSLLRQPRQSHALAFNFGIPENFAVDPTTAAARVAYVAAEVGARFVRERQDLEPIQWLTSPRRLFGGRTALEACQSLEGFRRAVVLHGLSLGHDADPAHLEGIATHHFLSNVARGCLTLVPPIVPDDADRRENGPPALYTCSISAELGNDHVQIFGAMLAHSPAEVRSKIRQRHGPLLEDEAQVRLGFDWSEPLACAMVSEAMAHLLSLVAKDPTSPLALGLDFQVEQRFAC